VRCRGKKQNAKDAKDAWKSRMRINVPRKSRMRINVDIQGINVDIHGINVDIDGINVDKWGHLSEF
jgi:hypothetical protein